MHGMPGPGKEWSPGGSERGATSTFEVAELVLRNKRFTNKTSEGCDELMRR